MAIFSFNEYVPSVDATAWVAESAQVIGRVAIDREASIWPGAVLRGDIADIRIGAGSNVQDNAVVHVETEHPCVVGENVTIGHSAVLHSCTVADGALIGMGAVVLNGARIGRHAVVGAGALVAENKVIPDRALVVGTPARFVRTLTDEEVAVLEKNNRRYQTLKDDFRTGLKRIDVPQVKDESQG